MLWNCLLFVAAATALLGSPGPAIAALVALGRTQGLAGGLPFYRGLQIGLAIAASLCGVGLFTALLAVPFASTALTLVAVAYLLWLAWSIATTPVGRAGAPASGQVAASFRGGLLLGLTNPKAYLAFVSLFGSFRLGEAAGLGDTVLKVGLCVTVMVAVDFAWLWIGTVLGRVAVRPAGERAMNVAMGATILAAAMATLVV